MQRKPPVSSPNDALEHEPGEVVDSEVRMAASPPIGPATGAIQRKCAACEDEEQKAIQTKPRSSASPESAADTGDAVRAARDGSALRSGGGVALDPATRAHFESRLGVDLGEVRIHEGAQAEASTRALRARAYTAGRDVVFGAGQYSPRTTDGKRLLAHELVHTAQQARTPGFATAEPGLSHWNDPAEREADQLAERIVAGHSLRQEGAGASLGPSSAVSVQRDELSPEDQQWTSELLALAKNEKRPLKERTVEVVQNILARFHKNANVGVIYSERSPYPYMSVKSDGAADILVGNAWLEMMLGRNDAWDLKADVDSAVKSIPDRRILAKANDAQLPFEGRVKESARQLIDTYFNDGVAVQQILYEEALAAPTAELASNGDVVLKVGKAFLQPRPAVENVGDFIPARKNDLRQPLEQVLGKKFEWALNEGPTGALNNLRFGRVCGLNQGDTGYDPDEWKQTGFTIKPRIEPWLAMSHMVENIGNEREFARSNGTTTPWKFDCAEAAIVLHVYAQWRTLSRAAFDLKFFDLELGGQSHNDIFDNATHIYSGFPTEPPTRALEDGRKTQIGPDQSIIEWDEPVGKSWDEILDEAPVGSQVVFQNWDANRKCAADRTLSFCTSWVTENTIKLGKDRYFAFGASSTVADAATIKREMAEVVVGAKGATPEYIKKFLHVTGFRRPKLKP